MPSETKPTVLIVPGGWHLPIHYEPLTKVLSSHGLPSVALPLPTLGASPPDKDLYDDIAYISSKLEELVEKEGREVILIVHSYGGIPGSSAARPFVRKERAQEGKKGGVIGVLYISSWAMPAGKTTVEAAEGMNLDWIIIDVSTLCPFYSLNAYFFQGPTSLASDPVHHFYNDIPPSDADFYASKLVTHCSVAITQPGTADCLNGVVPCTFLICENDNAVPIFVQERMAKNLGEGAKVERCSAGHSPFISQPDVVAKIIRRMAGENL